jgi:hypothetical protein
VPPYAELLERLRVLSVPAGLSPTDERAAIERRHVELSHAVRCYLGRSLEFPATESTTPEVRRALRAAGAPEPVTARTDDLLRSCDRVKFAREAAPAAALEPRVQAARELAAGLESHLHPSGPADPGGTPP